jgi:hypothetical protein
MPKKKLQNLEKFTKLCSCSRQPFCLNSFTAYKGQRKSISLLAVGGVTEPPEQINFYSINHMWEKKYFNHACVC